MIIFGCRLKGCSVRDHQELIFGGQKLFINQTRKNAPRYLRKTILHIKLTHVINNNPCSIRSFKFFFCLLLRDVSVCQMFKTMYFLGVAFFHILLFNVCMKLFKIEFWVTNFLRVICFGTQLFSYFLQ